MRVLRFGLRLWITLGSVLSFAAGWIMLAQSPKPVQPVSVPSVMASPFPTLGPLPPLNLGVNNTEPVFPNTQFQSPPVVIQQANPSGFLPPVFRTGGS